MTSPALLTGSHQRTYDAIFQHPVSHNLGWHDVHALFRQLGDVATEPNGNLKVTCHGHVLILHPPRTKDVASTDELMALRRFLEQSAAPPADVNGAPSTWLLVINHHEARIYRSTAPGTPAQVFRPHVPEDFVRSAPKVSDFSRGQEKPDASRYFAPVAGVLHGAAKFLIFGGGTGTGSEMAQFTAWVRKHHPELAARIAGSLVVDENHLTESQLLELAREFQRPQEASRP